MKRLFSVLSVAAVLAAALLFTGCEKHAYSYSTNKFRVEETKTVIGTTLTMKVGETLHIVGRQDSGKGEYLDGKYTGSVSDEQKHVEVTPGTYNGMDCLVLKGVTSGSNSVSIHLDHDGFDLHKTVTVTVN